ncbi:hypothetical protein V6N11_072878 [Hibiscus sabdariffa]|uniref:Uncharacterized protein n=1 Tax=Hibiscus sabdariffa TaxID=183260 RepID=A0ABR2P0W6_9ROSI
MGHVAAPMVEQGSVSAVAGQDSVPVVSPMGVQGPILEYAHVATSMVEQGPTPPAATSMVEQGHVVVGQESVLVEQGLASGGKARLHGCEANDHVEVVGSLDVASVSDPIQEPRLLRVWRI